MHSSMSTMFSALTHNLLILGNAHVLNGDFLLFTPLFRHSISLGLHLFFLLLTLSWVFLRRSRLKSYKTSGFLYSLCLAFSLGLCFLFGGLSTYHYLKYWDGSSVEITIAQVDWMEQAVAWGAISGFLRFGMPCKSFQILLRIWWLVFFILSFYSFVIDVAFYKGSNFFWADLLCSFAALFLCYVSLRRTYSTDNNGEAHLREPLLSGSTKKKEVASDVTPYATAGFFSLLTFSWLGPLFPVGNSKALDIEDVPGLDDKDSAAFVYPAFRSGLEDGQSSDYMGKLRLAKALFCFVWKDVAWAGFFCLLYTVSSFVGPYLIDALVQYVNGRQRFAHEGYILVSVFLVAKLVQSFSQRHWFFLTRQIGIRNRAALNATIYKKGLSLSSQSRKMHTSGEIINLMSVDADRIALFCWYVHDLWVVPLQIIIALAILYKNLGLASLAALVAAFLVMLANLPLVKSQEGLQEKLMESKDERMKATSEILRNMRILKFQAWEMRFLSKVMDLRKTETNWLRNYIYTTAFISFLTWGAPIFISAAAFGSCMLLRIPLMSGKVLSALATIEILQQPIYNLPDTISMIAQSKVSLDRIASFLRLEEMKPNVVEKLSKDGSTLAVEICDGVFSWDPSSDVPTLQNLNLKVQHGMKVAVCGIVGSSKTSLLSCILGELARISGTIRLSGTTAFVAQSPWIQSGKIEENILFGKEMDRDRYEHVIDACDLRKDIELLPFGDQTTIGERGINLSGGQKQRVQIARALYQDADIYLFDDPFSAVDAHTGSHLFKECLHGFLGSKTVIYVTHQVEFLPSADLVLVSSDQSELDLYIPELLAHCAFAGIQLLGSIAVISQISWQVIIIFIPVACAGIWLQQYYLPTSRELSRLVGLCKAPMIQHFAESIAGSSTIRSFNEESRFLNRNFQLIDGFSRPKFHVSAAMEWLCLRLDMLSSLIFAFCLIFLISLPKDAINPGIAGLAVTYGLNLNMLQMQLVWSLCNAENRMISVERILQYTRVPSEPPLMIETNRPSKKWPSYGEIDISELQVRYAPHLPLVLKGLTCNFRGGAKTGIVGRTGSGKSTLVQAIFRIIDPSYGQIVIDGIDISMIGLHDLRSRLSIIPQEPTMFQGTVRTNLDPLEEYADEQIWEALDKCQLGHVVRQKDGKLDATVTENGENWSVGQRQLVCLGRVLLKKSRILVLDEATASVDTATDGLIQQTLRQHFSDCSILTIAHRIASVLDSDMVLVMENGLVAEYESPSKLLQDTSSAFAKLVNEYVMRSKCTRS